jgi:Na+/melibiose symporter-like transporter
MFKNKSFITLLISFTCILGFFNLYGTIGVTYFGMYTRKGEDVSYVVGVANFAGIIGCIIVSVILDKYKTYKKAFLILNIIGIISQILLTVLLEEVEGYGYILLFILWTMVSVTVLPIYTCCMDFVCELTYPVGESISGGLIMSCTQISGIITVYKIIILDFDM